LLKVPARATFTGHDAPDARGSVLFVRSNPEGRSPVRMSRLGNALASSVGKKVVMGLTGLLLVGFLLEHLHGNLKLLQDPSGDSFDAYVSFLQGFGPLLTLAELGVAALFLAHVYLAFRLTHENFQARERRYSVRQHRGSATLGSISMFYTGTLILAYLLKHLADFRFQSAFFADPDALVKKTLSQPGHAAVYLVAAIVVGVHLSHGFRSALQSLGINHPRWNTLLSVAGKVVALLFAVGFAAFPIYFLLFWTPPPDR
jgi:succinate dehydrogenase / fumarate reductase cytochrome b subunit